MDLELALLRRDFFYQWRFSIWNESMPLFAKIVGLIFIPEMEYKLKGYL